MTTYQVQHVTFNEFYPGSLTEPSQPVTMYRGTLAQCRAKCDYLASDTEQQCFSHAHFYRIVEEVEQC